MREIMIDVYNLLIAEDKTMHCRLCNKSPRPDLHKAIEILHEVIFNETPVFFEKEIQ